MARLVSVALLAIFGLNAVSADPVTCTVRGIRVGYDPNTYNCLTDNQGISQICIKGQQNCGLACFSPNSYCCDSTGTLQQSSSPKCAVRTSSSAPATSTSTSSSKSTTTSKSSSTSASSSTSSSVSSTKSSSSSSTRASSSTSSSTSKATPATSGAATCNGQTFGSGYVCAINDQGQQKLCPSGSPNACGSACYSSSSYCCDTGSALKPTGQCKSNADQGGRQSTSTSAEATSQTTSTSASSTTSAPAVSSSSTRTSQSTSSTTSASIPATSSGSNNNNNNTGSGICGSANYDPCTATCALINGQYQITGKLVTLV